MILRIKEIDGLRGIAALAVVFFHLLSEYPRRYGGIDYDIFRFGSYGVQLFFVISGFVIFMSLKKNELKPFIVSRITRLYPVYWAGCIITFLVLFFFPIGLELRFSYFIVNLTMLQAFFGIVHIDGSYWTLSYELVFYFFAALMFISKKNTAIKCFFLLLVQTIYGVAINSGMDFSRPLEALLLLQFLNLFICGIIFYEYHSKKVDLNASLVINIIVLLNQYLIFGLESMTILLCIVLLFYLMLSGKLKFLSNSIFIYFGAVSYSLYIIHQYIGYTAIKRLTGLGLSQITSTLCAMLIVYLLALFIHLIVDKKLAVRFKVKLNKVLSGIEVKFKKVST